jgi:glycerate dehydrogenase
MSRSVVVSSAARERAFEAIRETIGDAATIVRLADLAEGKRAAAIAGASAYISLVLKTEFRPAELPLLAGKLVQLTVAGVDEIPFDILPANTLVAHNAGAAAEQMAEHVVAMALAASKKLFDRHHRMAKGEFDQMSPIGTLRDGACAIVGFGAIGKETARLMRFLGMRIYAVNRSGRTDENVEFIGTIDDLEAVLRAADVVVLSLALNRATRHLIGARQLGWMKRTATLINVARGGIVDQAALYRHLKEQAEFTACLDVWWVEPLGEGRFEIEHPFFDLPNLIGSPHNSAITPDFSSKSARHAARNVLRYLTEGRAERLVGTADRL